MRHYAAKYFMDPTHKISVSVIGIGGNGTQALNDLAKINSSLIALGHVGLNVTAYDDDIVEEPNIGRQKFSPQDLGQNKASVIVTRINRFYGTDWKAVQEKYKSKNKVDTNIIISCVDNVKTRADIHKDFIKINSNTTEYYTPYYWMDFGNGKNFGQFVLGSVEIPQPESKHETAPMLKNIFDIFPNMENDEDINEPSCSTREALIKQDLFINSLVVTHGMSLIWELLNSCVITSNGGYVNLGKGIVTPIKLK